MRWSVSCGTTTRAELDERYQREARAAELDIEALGAVCGGRQMSNVMECPEYHAVWRRYWWAVRDLEACARA